MKTKTISSQISKGGQSVTLAEVFKMGQRNFRISIKSDSYDFQSFARVEVMKNDTWHPVHAILYGEMATPTKLAYGPKPATIKDFEADRQELLRVAKELYADTGDDDMSIDEYLSGLSVDELKSEVNSRYESIYNTKTYGEKDVRIYYLACAELKNRNIDVRISGAGAQFPVFLDDPLAVV